MKSYIVSFITLSYITLGLILLFALGMAFSKSALKSNEYLVVMEFTSGNTIAFSEVFNSYDKCINSGEYKLHTFASGESGANIYCSNKNPTYK
jgi:hypothetical protein